MKSGAGVPSKFLPVPDSLVGERCDNGIAKMLGISRTKAQELIVLGAVLQNGLEVGKSDRLISDAMIEVELQEGPASL
jgi:23S rRNA pseudouridine1911/1915/1917 synthase